MQLDNLTQIIVDAIQDKKGKQVVVTDFTNNIDSICKHFIICTGNTHNHVEAIARNVGEQARVKAGEKPIAVTGEQNAIWLAMDYGDIMVHIFQPEARGFYDLEHLWADAPIEEIPDVDNDDNFVF